MKTSHKNIFTLWNFEKFCQAAVETNILNSLSKGILSQQRIRHQEHQEYIFRPKQASSAFMQILNSRTLVK